MQADIYKFIGGELMATLFIHYFVCEDCGVTFSIMTMNEHYSDVLGTIDCMASCPNSMCMSSNVYMDDVIVKEEIE